MEVHQDGLYWKIHNPHGPVPKILRGDWNSKRRAEEALMLFQKQVQSKAINVSQRSRERKERAAATS